jgi:hypothetical protein
VHDRERLSGWQVLTWTTLGVAAGVTVAFGLSEWVGGVNPPRLKRMARRIKDPRPRPALSAAAAARATTAALLADPQLRDLTLESRAVALGVVELARVAIAVAGIERVVNRILVRGEDDRKPAGHRKTDQSA